MARRALALNLDEDSIGAVVLGECRGFRRDRSSVRPAAYCRCRSGDGLLGRVVDSLGRPIDGLGPLGTFETRRLEVQAPGIIDRQPVKEPLQTGIKSIDAMTPIGRGQRELIIGDRKTGKTSIAIDTIINQRGQGVKCIYVSIGQKGSTVAQTVETLRAHGAMEYTVVVNSPASDPASFKYLAPYAGCAMGQHWMEHGEHAFDNLRRPLQAGRGVPVALVAAPSAARPRGLPWRRFLFAQPSARARRQIVRTSAARARLRPCRSWRPKPAISPLTSRPT